MNNKPIPYGRQDITEEDIAAVVDALKADFLTQGPRVAEFERAFADYVGAKYAVAVANGTAALHLCALALDVNEQSKVITSPITFAASANCIRYCGGEVIFADIDPETITLSLSETRKILEKAPKGTYSGIIPVDFAGHAVMMEDFRSLADEFGLWIIEDACHAPGAYFMDSHQKKSYCGSGEYADMAIFSFHPVKHIACGEGGMITTQRKDLYERLLILRTHGITKDPQRMAENHGGWYYEMQELGYNYRLTDFQSALGLSQLKQADPRLLRRRILARRYDTLFAGHPNIKPFVPASCVGHAYHLYIVQVPDRKGLYDELRRHNIFAQVHYIPVHTLPYYRSLEKEKIQLPNAEAYYAHALSLPMYPTLTEEEQDFVVEKVVEFCNHG